MASNNSSIQSLIVGVDLQQVLDTAETLSYIMPIPFLPGIIKVIKVLICFQPLAASAAGLVSKQIDINQNEKRAMFYRLWSIAIDDGIITEDEKKFLLPHAIAAGISKEEFELMIINQTTKH